MNKLMLAIALVALPAFAAKTPATTPAATDHSKDEAALKQLWTTFDAAWAKGDWKARAAIFADDAKLYSPMAEWATGRAEYEKMFQKESEMLKGTTHTSNPTWTYFPSNDWAYGDAEVMLTGVKTPEGKAAPDMKAKLFWVANKKAGKWAVSQVRTMMAPPMPAAPAVAAGTMGKGDTAAAPTTTTTTTTTTTPAKK